MDSSLAAIYESNSSTLYPLNAIASSSTSPLLSPQDEHSSRMRSHKGNRPSLPQSKYCSLCPAKFTRTTHLNRHLRSRSYFSLCNMRRWYAYPAHPPLIDTNERLHRCSVINRFYTDEYPYSPLL